MKQELNLKIGGKDRLLKFGTNQTAIFCDKHNLSLTGYSDSLNVDNASASHLRDLIWSSLVAGAKYNKEEIDFDEYDVGDWIDDLSQSNLQKIFDTMGGKEEGKKKPGGS